MIKEETKISWADYTFNPWVGCTKVTDGCKHCYAETMNKRFNGGKNWGPNGERRTTKVQNWNQVLRLNRQCKEAGIRKVVFCASLADVFEDNPQVFDTRLRLWDLIQQCDSLDWLLLTKRPQNIMRFVPEVWKTQWPGNVMPGVSVCSQKDYVLFYEMQIAAYRCNFLWFASMEPLLGYPDMKVWLDDKSDVKPHSVIVGGESGPGARTMHPNWVRWIKYDCETLGIQFHFKQWGEYAEECKELDGMGCKIVFIADDGTIDQFMKDTMETKFANGVELDGVKYAKMVRYGVKNTGNRFDGEYHMPKVFFQNTTPVF